MKGKIDVNCVISKEFSGELAIKSQAIIRNLNTTSTFGKNYGNLRVKPKHELKFDTVQYLASIHNQLNELDNKGGIIFKDLECDFIYAKQKNNDLVTSFIKKFVFPYYKYLEVQNYVYYI